MDDILTHIYREVWALVENAIITEGKAADVLGITLSTLLKWQAQDDPPSVEEIYEAIQRSGKLGQGHSLRLIAAEWKKEREEAARLREKLGEQKTPTRCVHGRPVGAFCPHCNTIQE
jgi:hypothetical protein